MWIIKDCLWDIEIGREEDKKKADDIARIRGGSDNCIHVFEEENKGQEKKREWHKEVKDEKKDGMLF